MRPRRSIVGAVGFWRIGAAAFSGFNVRFLRSPMATACRPGTDDLRRRAAALRFTAAICAWMAVARCSAVTGTGAVGGSDQPEPDLGPPKVSATNPRSHRTRRCPVDHFSFRIEGVKVIPTSNPSGDRKRVTVWPQGSFLSLTRIRYPCDSRFVVASSTLSTSNSSHACGTGMSSGHESLPKQEWAA